MMKLRSIILILRLFAEFAGALCPAQPAYVLDPAFRPPVTPTAEWKQFLVPLADGKLLVRGSFKASDGSDCYGLNRLNGDGTPDTTFNPFCLDAKDPEATQTMMVVGPRGDLLIGRNYYDEALGVYRLRLLRLDPDGRPIAELPAPDWVVVDFTEELNGDLLFSGSNGEFQRMTIDGKILAFGGGLGAWFGYHSMISTYSRSFGDVVLQASLQSDVGQGAVPPGLILRSSRTGALLRTFALSSVSEMALVGFGDGNAYDHVIVANSGSIRMYALNGFQNTEFAPEFSGSSSGLDVQGMRIFPAGPHFDGVCVLGPFDHVDGQRRRGFAIIRADGDLWPAIGPAERREFETRYLKVGPHGDIFVIGTHPHATDLSVARFLAVPEWRHSSHDAAVRRFSGTIGCLAGWKYRVEASTDLQRWDTVVTGTSAGESAPFADATPPGVERRFYRVVRE